MSIDPGRDYKSEFAFRRALRANRLLSELKLTDTFSALEEVKESRRKIKTLTARIKRLKEKKK